MKIPHRLPACATLPLATFAAAEPHPLHQVSNNADTPVAVFKLIFL